MSALMAYPLSVRTLPYRRGITFFIFFTMLFNGGLVPTYLMYVNYFHIKNTLWALVIPNLLLSANNVLMIRSYYMTSIPDALFEAAKIDGAGHLRIFLSLVLPLGKPILVTMGLFPVWRIGMTGQMGYIIYQGMQDRNCTAFRTC